MARRHVLLVVVVLYAVALAATIALASGGHGARWDEPRSGGARGATVPAPPSGPPPPGERAPLPRAGPSPDRALAPPGPVPPEPPVAITTTLGHCCSEERAGAPIDAIVVHSTDMADRPGTADLSRLNRFFARSGLASHVADDAEGNSIRMVPDALMAYHATYWNDVTVGIEQMGFATFTREEWMARRPELDTTARWIAHWARLYRIPIRRCAVSGIRYLKRRKRVGAGVIVQRGVCSHAQLDPRNRDDPGRGYPWDYVLGKARAIAAAAR